MLGHFAGDVMAQGSAKRKRIDGVVDEARTSSVETPLWTVYNLAGGGPFSVMLDERALRQSCF